MILRFSDGFELINGADDGLLKYPGSLVTFVQTNIVTGLSSGKALYVINTAFGESNWTKFLGAQQTWGVHVNFRIGDGGTTSVSYPDVEWYRINYGSQRLLALRLRPDGKMDIRTYDSIGGMTVLNTTTSTFPKHQWLAIQILGTFGTSGSWSVKVGTAIEASGTYNFGIHFPDNLTFRYQAFGGAGFTFDHYSIYDGSDSVIEFPGRSRVTTLSPIADVNSTWNRNTPGSIFGAWQDLNGADGDTTCASPSVIAAEQFEKFPQPSCFGLNLGVAANICARPITGFPVLSAVVQERTESHLIGQMAVSSNTLGIPPVGYSTYQSVTRTSQQTGLPWTDRLIGESAWGVGSDSVNVKVTQFYLEKVTSLEDLPFDCGQSSYGF